MDALLHTKKEASVSTHLHISHLNEPTIFECDNGQVGSVISVAGVPFDTASDQQLNQYQQIKHHAICMLGEMFCVYEHTCRRKLDVQLTGEFKDAFTRSVDEGYHDQFRSSNLYRNALYITVLYKGLDAGKAGASIVTARNLSDRFIAQARDNYRTKAMGQLKKQLQQFMAVMAEFKPEILGSKDDELGYSEVLTFLGSLVNGLSDIHFRYPTQNVSTILPASRLFFGEYLELVKEGKSCFAGILSIKEYATETSPPMLDKLLHLDAEYIHTNTFAIQPMALMQKRVVRQIIKMENAKDPAVSQINQLAGCRDDLASGHIRLGHHHNTLMILNDSIEGLKEAINKAIKFYADAGIVAVAETIGLEPAFWAQIPGNQKYIVRSNLITSQNFVDFCPLHNYRVGYRDKNHLGSAVTLIETPSKTPMFFNFHPKGSGDKNDLTPGHTTIIGGNGSGKTVFMGFMDSQMTRYGGRTFFFDRDRGMEIYVRAAGGVYAAIGVNHSANFNPFWLDDTLKNRSFLKSWMGQLVRQAGEVELPADIEMMLSECVDYAFDALAKEHRSLSTAVRILPIDFPRWDRLKKWLKGDDTRGDGEYAYLFDNVEDKLDISAAKVGFDLTELLDQPETILTSVCMYLVHRVKASLDGQRVSIYFDEGWQILDNPYWRKQLKQDLPTFRKLNAHIVLATQSPESVVNSALSAQFLDNCSTNIFFCNPNANFEKHYQHFSVSESEFEFIRHTPKELRLFLYKQAQDSAICRLNLSGMSDALAVYSGNKSTILLLDKIRAEVGDDPARWLPVFHARRRVGV